jgi:hypothetical protein
MFGRFLAGFVVVLLVIAGGASAGWWVHAQNRPTDASGPPTETTSPPQTDAPTDTKKLLESVSPGVVHVLATT